jgi:flagellar hook protein FlgE
VLSAVKNGSPASALAGVEIDETGLVDAIYDSGFRQTLYKVPVASVQNPNGMRALDGQAFQLTRDSGSVFFYEAGTGPTGPLVSSALEESTTDVAEELTQLIKTQRAYSSNAKIIQTVDEMLQETTNLKR